MNGTRAPNVAGSICETEYKWLNTDVSYHLKWIPKQHVTRT
jgi:hypothetical protein